MTKPVKLNRRGVSAKKVRELLQDHAWIKNEELSKRLDALRVWKDVYVHEDKQVLHVIFDGIGRLYNSLDDFVLLLEQMEDHKKQPSRHVLAGRLPQGKDFIEQVSQLVDELAVALKIPREALDGSLDSLHHVDKAIRRFGKKKAGEAPVFPMLVAYVGEVMRQATGGHWEMRFSDQDGKTWEPWIVDPQARMCNPYMGTYVELHEHSPFSIHSETSFRIAHRRVLPLADTLQDSPSHRGFMFIKQNPDTPSE